jgi:signal transduction histidine kinase
VNLWFAIRVRLMSLSRVLNAPAGSLSPPGSTAKPARSAGREPLRQPPGDSNARLLQPLIPMGAACAVAMLTLAGIQLGAVNGIVVLWLANGVAASIWVRAGKGLAFDLCFGGLILVGIVTGEFLAGNGPSTALILAAVNTLEILAAVMLMRRFAPGQALSTVRSAVILVGVTALIAPLIGAMAGSLALSALRGLPLATGFQIWWFGHALGMALVVPLVLSANRRSFRLLMRPLRLLEWGVLLAGVIGVAYAYYVVRVGPITFFLNIMLVVIAARLRMAGVSLAMLATSILMFATILYGEPPSNLVGFAPGQRILAAQMSMLSICLPFMLVAALLNERDGLTARSRAGQRRAELASESKSRLLANVAHEIKSPVAGVIGIGELWSSGQLGPVTAIQKEMAEMLVKTARQVETLAHDLLDVARAESGSVKVELRPTDVVGVLEDVCRATALRPDAKGLKVRVESEAMGLVALADSQRLTQVIDNLATNAVKYGASGGVVIFRAEPSAVGVRIEVVDKGPGLSAEKQTQLFEPFNRLGLERSAVEGHGIGLALSKRLVELQGGSIGVVSAPGEGAAFWVELPAA